MSEIEVPFELYQQWCRRCSDREETLTPNEEVMEQWTRFADQRKAVKIKCCAVNRCVQLQKLMSEKRLKRKRKNDTSVLTEKEDGGLLNY